MWESRLLSLRVIIWRFIARKMAVLSFMPLPRLRSNEKLITLISIVISVPVSLERTFILPFSSFYCHHRVSDGHSSVFHDHRSIAGDREGNYATKVPASSLPGTPFIHLLGRKITRVVGVSKWYKSKGRKQITCLGIGRRQSNAPDLSSHSSHSLHSE